MSTDPFDAVFDYSSPAYAAVLDDAARDDRVGNHEAVAVSVVKDTWPSGDPRLKVTFILKTAHDAKADFTWSPPPPPDVVAAERATYDRAKLQGIAKSINTAKQLAEYYKIGPGQIKQGDTFKVKTSKTRVDDDGSGGFIRVVAFLAKDHAVGQQTTGAQAASSTTSHPF